MERGAGVVEEALLGPGDIVEGVAEGEGAGQGEGGRERAVLLGRVGRVCVRRRRGHPRVRRLDDGHVLTAAARKVQIFLPHLLHVSSRAHVAQGKWPYLECATRLHHTCHFLSRNSQRRRHIHARKSRTSSSPSHYARRRNYQNARQITDFKSATHLVLGYSARNTDDTPGRTHIRSDLRTYKHTACTYT